jgi:hypothetical protein
MRRATRVEVEPEEYGDEHDRHHQAVLEQGEIAHGHEPEPAEREQHHRQDGRSSGHLGNRPARHCGTRTDACVSQATAGLLGGNVLARRLRSLGERTLPDFDEPTHLYELTAP